MKCYMNGNDLWITEYNSLGEFLQDIDSKPNNEFFKDRHSSQRTESPDKRQKWYMTQDYRRASYLLTHGWDEAAEKMAKKVKITLGSTQTVRSSKPSYGVVGSQASVPRYLQGIPTNMVSRQMTYSKQKVITLTKGISYSCRWTPEQILEESIKALQIIQALETNGQRVRLNVMWSISDDHFGGIYHTICKVCVKQPDERLNISKIAYALAHPSMLRRHFFKWLETDTFTSKDMGWCYGCPASIKVKERGMGENEHYIPEEIVNMDELIEQLQNGKATKAV